MPKKMSVKLPAKYFGLDFINQLKPAMYRYQAPLNDGRDHFGFIAQDVAKLANKEDYNFVTVREGFYGLNYLEFIGPMVKAIQELSAEVKELKNELATIKTGNRQDAESTRRSPDRLSSDVSKNHKRKSKSKK